MSPRIGVVVPAVLGVGLLFSLATFARDAVHRLRGRRAVARRARLEGHATAVAVVAGEAAARRDALGWRSRRVYAWVGPIFLAVSVYLLAGSWGNYIGWTGWVESIGWIWLAYLVVIGAFAAVGVVATTLAVRWTDPPAWIRPLLARTPLSQAPGLPDDRPERGRLPVRAPRPDAVDDRFVDERQATIARIVAAAWALVAVVVLSLAAMRDWLPQAIDPSTIEPAVSGPVQLGLLFVYTLGSLLAVKVEAVGAAVMAMAGAALAVLAAIQYPPGVAVGVAVAVGTPAFLHWLAWQRQRHVHHLFVLATTTAVLIGAVWWGAARLHTAMTGPAHPESPLTAAPASAVTWVWAGGTTSRSTVVVARLEVDDEPAQLVVGEQPDLVGARVIEPSSVDTATDTVRFAVDGLEPARTYHYAVQVDGQPVRQQAGSVRTFPEGAGSFTVAFGSCSRSGSNGSVFDAIRDTDPIAYLELGDINYANVRDDDLGAFLAAWDSVLTPPAQSALYRSTSSAYVWDDHDYGGNDANRTSPSRPAAHAAYRAVVPHYPLAPGAETGTGAVHQAFTIGRVRFLLTDARSERDPASEPDGPDKTMLGAEQERWLTEQLRASRDEGVPLTVWLNGTPWIDAAAPGEDTWGGYAAERERIATAIRDLGMADRLVMLSGDAHMVALDDGTNSGYAAGGGGGFPVAHGAALDRPGGAKGGPFSDGMYPGSGQFGTLAVDDDGSRITITIEGRRYDGTTLVAQSFTFPG